MRKVVDQKVKIWEGKEVVNQVRREVMNEVKRKVIRSKEMIKELVLGLSLLSG